jgi:copper/silver efflux system protein
LGFWRQIPSYTVAIRYPRDYRSDPEAIADQVLIPMPDGGTVPLREVAKVSLAQGSGLLD